MSRRKLYRNTDDAFIAGVMAGVADYTGHDVTIWRLVAIAVLLLSGVLPAVFLYIVAWYVVPVSPLVSSNSEI